MGMGMGISMLMPMQTRLARWRVAVAVHMGLDCIMGVGMRVGMAMNVRI